MKTKICTMMDLIKFLINFRRRCLESSVVVLHRWRAEFKKLAQRSTKIWEAKPCSSTISKTSKKATFREIFCTPLSSVSLSLKNWQIVVFSWRYFFDLYPLVLLLECFSYFLNASNMYLLVKAHLWKTNIYAS